MKKKWIWMLCLLAAFALSGCGIRTIEEMYCLPKRSESYQDLQSAIDSAMVGMEYCAPLAGENQQTVQMADLDGDGNQEYLLFAKSGSEKPLQILVFSSEAEGFALRDVIDGNGTHFDLVEYVQMDDDKGVELVVGRQLSDQVLRSVSVYTMANGKLQQLMSTNYSKLITCDLDTDGHSELMVLRPGQSDTDNGVAELYGMIDGAIERFNEAPMSGPTDRLKRILIGKLHGGAPAVFVGSTVEESAIITDIYTVVDGHFTNVSLSNESGTSVQTLRNYYVYAEDIDDDGEVELPDLITMQPMDGESVADRQYLIRWYAMATDGSEVDKMYTYHNFVGGWYLELEEDWASRISVVRQENNCSFYLWDTGLAKPEKIFTVYALTGQDRETQALEENRFVLHKSESIVYAAHLEVASGLLEISQADMIRSFHLIRQDWKTGEM